MQKLWGNKKVIKNILYMKLVFKNTHFVHVFRLRGGSVPAIIQDENVGFRKAFIYFVEEVFLL